MVKQKEIPIEVRNRIVSAHKAGKGYKSISKQLELPVSSVRAVVQKYKKYGITTSLPRSGRPRKITARAERNMLREVSTNPRLTSSDIQKSLSASEIHVHTSTIRKRLSSNGVHGRIARRKPLLSKKNIAARLKFAQEHIAKPESYWKSVLWSDETQIELFSQNQHRYVWRKVNTAFEQ